MTVPPTPSDRIAVVESVIRGRRTCLQVDPDRRVERDVVAELCDLATWAPNHRRTEPWRFAAFDGDGRARLGDCLADALATRGAPPDRVTKTRRKYLRAPVVVVVATSLGVDEVDTAERRDAVAAGVQNLLLAATARGLASFWSSVPVPDASELLDLCGFESGARAIAAIYLGHPTGECPPPPRRRAAVGWIS